MNRSLLSKTDEHVTIDGDSSSNDEHIVEITINSDSSSSSNEQTQREVIQSYDIYTEEHVWDSLEFVMTLVQIVAAIVALTRAKGKQPEATWIVGYTCGCIATLPILYWRFCHHQYSISEIRIHAVLDLLEMMLEYYFVAWFVLFVWVFFISNPSPLDHTTQLFWLCMAFLAFSCVRHVLPNLKCSAACFCSPVTLSITVVWQVIKRIVILIRGHLARIS